ncbi:transcription factor Adf-1-like [Episyrphus balteatus]|uniref:transcription factor Adf-1-like n=1 Tax=Episyrphus balteatus TaxID=286459 RepID=UPI002484DEA5|nr:transcription factor Adf-1-like [Episyrphus balteatus]
MSSIVEEELIEQVRANPILYDLKNKQYRNLVLRKETWDSIGDNLGSTGDHCKESWNKLRNAYTNALNRRKSKTGQTVKKMPKWVFEDQMAFLPVSIGPRHGRRNSIELEQDESQEHTSDNDLDDDDEDNNHHHHRHLEQKPLEINTTTDETTHHQPSPPLLRTVNEALSTDHSDIAATNFHTYNNNQEHSTPKRGSKTSNSILEGTMNELVTVMKNNTRLISRHFKSQNHHQQSVVSQNCSHDADEMYFLSLARFVKKLNPAERIRVKSEVSQTIFQAEFRNLKNDGKQYQQAQAQLFPSSISQNVTTEQFFSETTITNLKTEKD